jgi:hypothetical protein
MAIYETELMKWVVDEDESVNSEMIISNGPKPILRSHRRPGVSDPPQENSLPKNEVRFTRRTQT